MQIGPKPKNAHPFGREGTTPHHYHVRVDLVPRSANCGRLMLAWRRVFCPVFGGAFTVPIRGARAPAPCP